ncbi:B12-binding domain-containing radical SAM protein [Desulfuromonas sp. KJ2020]|uniref:B12-binding domain-containing radical SAM protein n=1 Tax=Desulfuromonas sp. KJ2020 TaxID=2919173 RepID=UPI0020A6F9CD|nr:radical SAM protein [Desulfuromonas sp. KJ2020]MCP3178425.1 B12-binding domain-containing radical SAM protein [Desulfuromonas sp. KJ2020]
MKTHTKALFVIPTYIDQTLEQDFKSPITVPYGILSLASYVKERCPSIEIRIIDFNTRNIPVAEQESVLRETLQEFDPDLVGIALMFSFFNESLYRLAALVKQIDPHRLVVAGGIAASNLHAQLLAHDAIDAVCIGEGEIPFLDLVLSEDRRKTLQDHPSWATLENVRNGEVFRPTFVQDLDEIPPIDYGLIDLGLYGERLIGKNQGKGSRYLVIHTTRGCPFDCIFCCAAANHGKKIRSMSPERVISDTREMVERYQLERLGIEDDQFVFNAKRAKAILKGLAEFHLKVEIPNGLSVRFIDDEMARLMRDAGVEGASLAIESGSSRVLKDIIRKPLNLSEVKPAVDALRKYDISTLGLFVIGIPGETDEDRQASIDFIRDLELDWAAIHIATPFPGSRLYDLCLENGYINVEDLSQKVGIYKGLIRTEDLDPEEMTEFAYLMNLEVNFVQNNNLRTGRYAKAAIRLKNVVDKYPDQAFAHYYLARAYEHLPHVDPKLIQFHRERFYCIIAEDKKWMEYALRFNLVPATEISMNPRGEAESIYESSNQAAH